MTGKTKWEMLQHRFKNSWFGIAILSLIAIVIFLSQIGDSWNKLVTFIRPAPAAELRIQSFQSMPLPQYSSLVSSQGSDTIYPIGAIVRFDLRHVGPAAETISINSLDVNISYDAQSTCPFELTGDDIFGAGFPPLRVFQVRLSHEGVKAVKWRKNMGAPIMRGRSDNILDLEPPRHIVLRGKDGEDVEAIQIQFVADDPGRYNIGLAASFTNSEGIKEADITSITVCKPRD